MNENGLCAREIPRVIHSTLYLTNLCRLVVDVDQEGLTDRHTGNVYKYTCCYARSGSFNGTLLMTVNGSFDRVRKSQPVTLSREFWVC